MNSKDTKTNVLKILIIMFAALLTAGTAGFMILSGDNLWVAFYQTVLILLTHFYHEVSGSVSQQILILILILGSYIIVAYVIKFLAEYFFEGTFKENRRKKTMEKRVNSYADHYIICGYGRVGRQIAEELEEEKVDFVVIDRDPVEAEAASGKGYVVIPGDPTDEQVLLKAGILKAKSIIIVPGSEVDSLYIVLSARSLNPDIYIIARARREEGMAKIKKAGANEVTMPEQIAGYHIATMALRPAVVDFLDIIVDGKHDELQIEEVQIGPGSVFVNRPLSFYLSQTDDVAVLAINRVDGSNKINPAGNEMLSVNDRLILMGARKQLEKVSQKIKA